MDYGKQAYNSDQVRILVILSLMMLFSTVIFFLRLLARRISVARYWWDDYTVFVALVRPTQGMVVSCKLSSLPSNSCYHMVLPSVCSLVWRTFTEKCW